MMRGKVGEKKVRFAEYVTTQLSRKVAQNVDMCFVGSV